jgi:hypothetical protein
VNPLAIAEDLTYLVYDATGHVVHIHQITSFRGAKVASAKEAEARALEMARLHGHPARDLRLLKAPPDLDLSTPLRVEPGSPPSIRRVELRKPD